MSQDQDPNLYKKVGYTNISDRFVVVALTMPEDTVLRSAQLAPDGRTLTLGFYHPDLPEIEEGGIATEVIPNLRMTDEGIEADWGPLGTQTVPWTPFPQEDEPNLMENSDLMEDSS